MSGIGCRLEAEPVIRHNRCHDNEMAGIGSQQGARPVIVGNECFGNVMAGIGTETEAEAIIRSNKCYQNQMAGIGARDRARAIIDGNLCYENTLAGIGSQDGAETIIRGNQCSKNEAAGIGTQSGANALIVDNQCRENKRAGIGVREKATAVILDNKCLENQLVAIGARDGSSVHIARNLLARTGGMPPMIAIREDSTAVVADNTIKGGGVAGVMVQGTAAVSGNRFEGNGPRRGGPPNFAAWVQAGSNVSFCDNRTDRWRHAVFAAGAKKLRATGNTASKFLGTAIVVKDSASPTHVFGNVAISDNEQDQAASVTGPQGVVTENLRIAPTAKKEEEKATAPGSGQTSARAAPLRVEFVAFHDSAKTNDSESRPQPSSALSEAIADEHMWNAVKHNLSGVLTMMGAEADVRSKVDAFLTNDQWAATATLFRVLRRDEVHMINHHEVHNLVPQLLDDYLKEAVSSRITSGDGRFTREELVAMQMVRDKYVMWKTIRGFVMPPLQALTDAHADAWLRDERVMTRMMADRLIEKNVLGDELNRPFASALSKAGFAASLANGPDEDLHRRTKQMLHAIDLQAVAAKAGLEQPQRRFD